MPPTWVEFAAALLGAALCLLAAPWIILAGRPVIGYFLHALYLIGVLGHG